MYRFKKKKILPYFFVKGKFVENFVNFLKKKNYKIYSKFLKKKCKLNKNKILDFLLKKRKIVLFFKIS